MILLLTHDTDIENHNLYKSESCLSILITNNKMNEYK